MVNEGLAKLLDIVFTNQAILFSHLSVILYSQCVWNPTPPPPPPPPPLNFLGLAEKRMTIENYLIIWFLLVLL